MSSFVKATFNTKTYSSFRPSYPPQLFDSVFRYHQRTHGARWETAVDLGCGTGQATAELTLFKKVIGVDPSAKMLLGAREHINSVHPFAESINQFSFVQSSAEDIPTIPDGAIDLVIGAQSCHWFDWQRMWPETARILRKGGSAAFWVYTEFRLSKYPGLTPLITEYAQGTDAKTSLGPHWERPGRSILENHLLDVPSPLEVVPGVFSAWERTFYTGDHYPNLESPLPVILRRQMAFGDLLSYFRTFSSLHTYHEKFPEDLEHPDGDIATRFYNALREGVVGEGNPLPLDSDKIDVEWPVALIMIKKSS